MPRFYTGDYASVIAGDGNAWWTGNTFKPSTSITVTSLIAGVNSPGEAYVAIFEAQYVGGQRSSDGTLTSLITSADLTGLSGNEIVIPITPVTLQANQWYVIAIGAGDGSLAYMSGLNTYNPADIVAGESFLNGWGPTAADDYAYWDTFWTWAVQTDPAGMVGRSPDTPGVFFHANRRPIVGFDYGFNIWVKKGGEWIHVTEVWTKKGGVWQAVTDVSTLKGGSWNTV